MKVYVVMETYRDYDEGRDNICGIFLSEEKATSHASNLEAENKDACVVFSVLEEEVFE